MKALHFGAGNIGRGFIGKLLADANADLTFADVNQPLIDQLDHQQCYRVNIVGEHRQTEQVEHIRAINSTSPDAIRQIAQADIVTTAVGAPILASIATILAKGLIARHQCANSRPLNIIACENLVRGTSQLKQYVLDAIPVALHAWVDQHIGFIDSAVDRIVPPSQAANDDPLEVTVESFSEWIVDQTQFKGELPTIRGMEPTENLMAYIERKLFTLNTGHAITAYLGHLVGLNTIREAILTPAIRAVVKSAMEESGAVLIKRYSFVPEHHAAYIQKILTRFENPSLHDDVMRVGRQPLRKLAVGDRLIQPLLGALEYGLPHHHLTIGIAAALNYRNPADPQGQELLTQLDQQGVELTLAQVCGLHQYPVIVKEITFLYNQLSPTGGQ